MEYTVEQKELMLQSKAWPDRWAMARIGYRLDILVKDEDANVRAAVAHQGYELEALVNDEDDMVRTIALEKTRELQGKDDKKLFDSVLEDAIRKATEINNSMSFEKDYVMD